MRRPRLLPIYWACCCSLQPRTAFAQTPTLELRKGDRVVLVGNTLAERLQLFNHFETLLHTRFPELQLAVRNLGWSGDTITLQPRPLELRRRRQAPRRAEGRRHPLLSSAPTSRLPARPAWRSSSRTSMRISARISPRATTARRRRVSRWSRRSRTSGSPACHGSTSTRATRELERYTDGDGTRRGGARRRVRRSLHADEARDGRRGRAAHDQRHPRERGRRPRGRARCSCRGSGFGVETMPEATTAQARRRSKRCASWCARRTSSSSTAGGR